MLSKQTVEGEESDGRRMMPISSRLDAKDVPVATTDEISKDLLNLKCESKKRVSSGSDDSRCKDQLGGCLRQHFLDSDGQLDMKVILPTNTS
jgi:hypothetical protein